jgi:hypothetical protein
MEPLGMTRVEPVPRDGLRGMGKFGVLGFMKDGVGNKKRGLEGPRSVFILIILL